MTGSILPQCAFYVKCLNLLTKKKADLKVDAFSSDFQHMRGQNDSSDHLFSFNIITDKRHSSVTAGMPIF